MHIGVRGRRRVGIHRLAEGSGGGAVVVSHPAPGSGLFDPDPVRTQARGVSLLGVDRPGYGESDPLRPGEWSSVDLAAGDLAEVVGQLRLGPVGVVGWAAGGRVALAFAARYPALVSRVALLSTPARAEAVPELPPDQIALLEALRGEPPARAHRLIGAQYPRRLPDDPRDALRLLGITDVRGSAGVAEPSGGEVGAEPVAADDRVRLLEMLSAGYRRGPAGLAADIAGAYLRPWGFDPSAVRVPVLLLYGSDDPVVGPEHGKWWHERLADSRFEQVPGTGSLLVISRWDQVLDFLTGSG